MHSKALQSSANENKEAAKRISLESLNLVADTIGALEKAHGALEKLGDFAEKAEKLKAILGAVKQLQKLRDGLVPILK